MGTVEGGIDIHHLATLEGFAFAIFLSEDRIVCAAKDGDGCPCLLDWRSGRVCELVADVPPDLMQMEYQVRLTTIHDNM